MFETRGLCVGYDGVQVISDLDMDVGNEVFAILGANGAGKTTLLAAIAGLLATTAGTLQLRGDDVTASAPWVRASRGLAYVPQEGGTFGDLSVIENLRIGGKVAGGSTKERIEEVIDVFPALAEVLDQKAGTLSGGQSRMLAAGRALMQDPILLLLDEPTAGLAPLYVDNFFDKIRQIHDTRGVAIIVTEQNATKALEVADRVMMLSLGRASAVVDAADLTTEQLKEGYRI